MRADTSRMIADNPSTITITRKTSTVTDGKKASTSADLDPQTFRLYHKNKTERVREGDDFRFLRVRQLRMLCEYDADVTEHSDANEDTFTAGPTYRITDVREIKWEGVTVSKQCTLEEMS
jgi:hypothetical protein